MERLPKYESTELLFISHNQPNTIQNTRALKKGKDIYLISADELNGKGPKYAVKLKKLDREKVIELGKLYEKTDYEKLLIKQIKAGNRNGNKDIRISYIK